MNLYIYICVCVLFSSCIHMISSVSGLSSLLSPHRTDRPSVTAPETLCIMSYDDLQQSRTMNQPHGISMNSGRAELSVPLQGQPNEVGSPSMIAPENLRFKSCDGLLQSRAVNQSCAMVSVRTTDVQNCLFRCKVSPFKSAARPPCTCTRSALHPNLHGEVILRRDRSQ